MNSRIGTEYVSIESEVPTVNPLTPKSNKHLISPYKITSDSHIQVMEIKEMIIK